MLSLYTTPFCMDSCVISAAPAKTLSSFIPQGEAAQHTERWRLFCFWILVNVFHSASSGWSHGLWWGAIDNICPSLVSLHITEGSGRRDEVGVRAPFLKFTWTRVQTGWRGRAALTVWVSPHKILLEKLFRCGCELLSFLRNNNTIHYLWHLWQKKNKKHLPSLCCSLASVGTQ